MQNEADSVAFQTSADIAYRIISKKILDGEYPPGMKLSRRKMAEVSGVSVIPVIEALKRLEGDNLIEARPQWGSYVTVPTREKVKHQYEFREAIECQCARILAATMTESQKVRLMELAQTLDMTGYQEDTVPLLRESHFAFHSELCAYTGNALLIDSLRKINMFWILCKALRERRSERAVPNYWHRKLVDEIASGDPERAAAAMRVHVLDSLDVIMESFPSA